MIITIVNVSMLLTMNNNKLLTQVITNICDKQLM